MIFEHNTYTLSKKWVTGDVATEGCEQIRARTDLSLVSYRIVIAISSYDQVRSKRSRFITLFHAATKSCRNFSWEPSHP